MLFPSHTKLFSYALGPGVTSQLIDLLIGAAYFSLDGVASSTSPNRLEAAVGLQRLQHGH